MAGFVGEVRWRYDHSENRRGAEDELDRDDDRLRRRFCTVLLSEPVALGRSSALRANLVTDILLNFGGP